VTEVRILGATLMLPALEARSSLQTEQHLHAAVASAIRFFAGSREPFALLWLDVMHERFGIEEFADALRRFDEVLTEQPKQLPLLRVFRRIAAHDNVLRAEDMDAVQHLSDRMVVTALYSDQLQLPPSFPEVLAKATTAGGYYVTHALLASIWIREHGREAALRDELIESVYSANAALIDSDPKTVTDVKLEAAAFLYLAGQGVRVTDAFVASVVANQNRDGGWGQARDRHDRSDWHATVLGLMLLLHVESR
jgi:hypothetical protein